MPTADSLCDHLLETWRINHRINLFLLESLTHDQLKVKVDKSKSVAGHFAHQHNVRLMWIKAAGPELLSGLEKLEDGATLGEIASAQTASALATEKLILEGLAVGRIKNFKPHPTAFVGYLIAHEAFHRSQAELSLRQAGFPVSDKVGYGLWEWGSR
jgi:uncharacterized damage-inducible protein DinB